MSLELTPKKTEQLLHRLVARVEALEVENRALRTKLPWPFEQGEAGPGTLPELQLRAYLEVDPTATNAEQLRQVNLAAARIVAAEPERWSDARGRGRYQKSSADILAGRPDAKVFWVGRVYRRWRGELQGELKALSGVFEESARP